MIRQRFDSDGCRTAAKSILPAETRVLNHQMYSLTLEVHAHR